jgi:transcriptional regulator with XRE-family HTH domain
MSRARELLLECKIKLGIQSDYKLAKAFEIHTGRIADYMSGKRTPDAYTCVRIALVLGKDPAEVIAEIEAETEKNETRKAFWLSFLARISHTAKRGTLWGMFLILCVLGQIACAEKPSGFSRRAKFA